MINTKNSLISDDSFVYIYGKRLLGEMSSNQVFNELYGNKYGAKTIRWRGLKKNIGFHQLF